MTIRRVCRPCLQDRSIEPHCLRKHHNCGKCVGTHFHERSEASLQLPMPVSSAFARSVQEENDRPSLLGRLALRDEYDERVFTGLIRIDAVHESALFGRCIVGDGGGRRQNDQQVR